MGFSFFSPEQADFPILLTPLPIVIKYFFSFYRTRKPALVLRAGFQFTSMINITEKQYKTALLFFYS